MSSYLITDLRGFSTIDAPQLGNYHTDNVISGFFYRLSELSVHTLQVITKAAPAHREIKPTCHQAIIISLARAFQPRSASEDTFALQMWR